MLLSCTPRRMHGRTDVCPPDVACAHDEALAGRFHGSGIVESYCCRLLVFNRIARPVLPGQAAAAPPARPAGRVDRQGRVQACTPANLISE